MFVFQLEFKLKFRNYIFRTEITMFLDLPCYHQYHIDGDLFYSKPEIINIKDNVEYFIQNCVIDCEDINNSL